MRVHRTFLVGLLTALVAVASPLAARRTLPAAPALDTSISQPSRQATDLARVASPGVRVLGAVAWDIDRDGDLDVVGSTVKDPVVVWLNDGQGHFTRQDPAPVPMAVSGSGSIEPDFATASLAAPPPRWSSALPAGRRLADLPPSSISPWLTASFAVSDRTSASQSARAPPVSSPLS